MRRKIGNLRNNKTEKCQNRTNILQLQLLARVILVTDATPGHLNDNSNLPLRLILLLLWDDGIEYESGFALEDMALSLL